jgi:hypothetical protein
VQKPDGNIVKIAAAGTYTLTIPATGTAALRNTVNTFSEAQTFSVNPIMSGARPAADSTAAFRIFKADNATPVLTVDTTNSRVITTGMSSTTGVTIADDAVTTVLNVVSVGVIVLWISAGGAESGQESGMAYYRATGTPRIAAFAAGSLVGVTTSDVTGTTGTDGMITISATNGALKIENRLGVSITARWQLFL